MQQRLLLCQDRCTRYALFSYIPAAFALHTNSDTNAFSTAGPALQLPPLPSHGNHPNTHQTNQSQSHAVHSHAGHDQQLARLVEELEEDIRALEEEKEDLELELMEAVKAKDRTPDAILFFALMHDPSYIPNLQQLCLQMKQIKGFLDYSVHMDYVTLRKRLQVCLVLVPNIDKLVEKYGLMYQQWSHFRRNWFAERNLRGGSAESFTTCPLCYRSLLDDTPNQQQQQSQQQQRGRSARSRAKKQIARSGNQASQPALESARSSGSRRHGQSAALAASRHDERMLQQQQPLPLGGSVSSAVSSSSQTGRRVVSHSISLPALPAAQR